MRLRPFIFLICFCNWQVDLTAGKECKDEVTYCQNIKQYCTDETSIYHTFTLTNCKRTCEVCPEDIDPLGLCTNDNGGCDHACTVEDKKRKVCSCYEGYTLKADGKTCTDIDECASDENKCGLFSEEVCRNLMGSFACDSVLCDKGSEPYAGRSECCIKEPLESPCGSPRLRIVERIVGGNESGLGQWPWQVYILINTGTLCGGTVLNKNWVLTAGHCFREESPDMKMELYFGIVELDEQDKRLGTIQKRERKRHILFPGWNKRKFEVNDVALIELNKPLKWTDYVRPACLPNGEKPKVGTKCFASGWGLTDESSTRPSNPLQHVDLPIVDPVKCAAAYKKEETKVNSTIMICAGYDEGGKDACRGDSGGPLVCQRCDSCTWYVAGVVSFGSGCAQQGFYGVYANVHYFEDWISEHTGIHVSKAKRCTGPYLTQWSGWDSCSKSCGRGGTRARTRRCLDKGSDSDACTGNLRETQKCPFKACPTFGDFGEWSSCSESCGGGTRTKFKKCNNGEIGDDGCPKDEATKTEGCNEQPCPHWSEWDTWTTCSITCGEGTEKRSRNCINGEASVDAGCKGDIEESRKCKRKICPGWSSWGPWAECSRTCAGGTRLSSRNCNGDDCPGKSTREEECNTHPCPRFAVWETWGKCPVTCGGATIIRRRRCIDGNVGDAGCDTGDVEKKACNEMKCPNFSEWSDWDDCSVSCGGGKQGATRECVNGSPGQEGCIGPVERTQTCSPNECIGKFGPWSAWTTCSHTCGDGTHSRTRSCDGGRCTGDLDATESCNMKECPKYSEWEQWGECSKSCEGGEQSRTRECLHSTSPSDCPGKSESSRRCNENKCPGEWAPWSEWGSCDVKCGKGVITRKRDCEGGETGEPNCDVGMSEESKPCELDPCPSTWEEWGRWSRCSKSCDRGLQTRTRECIGGPIGQGSCNPSSAAKDERHCNEVICGECYDYQLSNYCEVNFSTKESCDQFEDLARLYCPKRCNYCPGLHEVWQSWGPCRAKCGRSGSRTRKRDCKVESGECEGESRESERCRGSCSGFSEWSAWGTCTVTCGEGSRTRTRSCSIDACDADETGSTALDEEGACEPEECPGTWLDWTEWGSCSVTCGSGGEEERTRKCNKGRIGGPGCVGEASQSRKCTNPQKCPDKWSEWSDWSICSVTCGEGSREKTRQCLGNARRCPGKSKLTETCNDKDCPVWGAWSGWSECDKDCRRTRTRSCLRETQQDDSCKGKSADNEDCDASKCPGSTSACEGKIDFSIRCLTIDGRSCRTQQVLDLCQKKCCEEGENVIQKCTDDPNYKNLCSFKHLCKNPQYKALFQIYCRKSCGLC